jgi:DNA polymerase-4
LRFPDFRTITRAVTLLHATDVTHEIAQAATALLESSLPQERVGIRLLGVGISQFTGGEREQQCLF